jgi:hypothetical protein
MFETADPMHPHQRMVQSYGGVVHKEAGEVTTQKQRDRHEQMKKPVQVLIARRSMNLSGRRFPVGSILPVDEIGAKQLEAMVNAKAAVWQPRTRKHYPEAYALDAPQAAKPRPAVQLVDGPDVVDSWRETEDLMTRLCGGDRLMARDVLFGDAAARDLYKRATTEQCRRIAKRLGRPSVDPTTAWAVL